MSDAQARQRAIDYMVRLVQMNPMHEGDEIVKARSKALGLAKKEAANTQDVSEPKVERRKLLDQLDAIRAEFWSMPIDALQAKLATLNAGDYADLQAAVTRLQVVAAHRSQFPKLTQMTGFDGHFFSALKEVLIQSPRETAVLREQVLSTFRNRARRKSGRKMVELLQNEMPAVYELEAGWFETLRRQKPPILTSNVKRVRPATMTSSSGAGQYWWIILLFGSAALRAIFSHSDHTINNNYQPSKSMQIKDLPPDVQSLFEREKQKERDSQSRRYPTFDKDVWRPYGEPIPPESVGQPDSQSPIKIDDRLRYPNSLDSNGPWKKPDDGFPR
jgi:hypothetical protein